MEIKLNSFQEVQYHIQMLKFHLDATKLLAIWFELKSQGCDFSCKENDNHVTFLDSLADMCRNCVDFQDQLDVNMKILIDKVTDKTVLDFYKKFYSWIKKPKQPDTTDFNLN